MDRQLSNFNQIQIAPATFNEYKTLARFHYIPRRPSTVADVVAAFHRLPDGRRRCVGVAVLSWPTACNRLRQQTLRLNLLGYGQRLRFANQNLRTISRVIVHPTYRSLGLAKRLIETLIARCPTRYVEASARMAHAHPMFDRAGMTRVEPENSSDPVYFLYDKLAKKNFHARDPAKGASQRAVPRRLRCGANHNLVSAAPKRPLGFRSDWARRISTTTSEQSEGSDQNRATSPEESENPKPSEFP